jgi:cellulose synthase/poly-beta-1,6-N-acetylglucosamine synthase-like glycosyltransferase/peptidoglycan/xylan/chitin deacetylase (PgdA/CDA1 family)
LSARAADIRSRIRRPPGHWTLLAFLGAVLLLLLFVEGVTEHTIGTSGTAPHGTGSVARIDGSGPIVTEARGHLVGRAGGSARDVALTFDDGPSGRWTPRIAAVLRRLRAPATFFEVGSEIVRHPAIVRRLHAEGFELGDHTFTHAYLTTLPGWERDLQVSSTQSALAGAAGVTSKLLRPPYSSTRRAFTTHDAAALARFAHRGYAIVLTELDTRDWESGRSVSSIVASAIPPGRRGGIVLMHDGGGNRSRTLAALPSIVARLRARGLKLVTVSDLLGIPRSAVNPPASGWEHARGSLLLTTLGVARGVTYYLTLLLIPIAVLMLLRAGLVVVLARAHARRRRAAPPAGDFAAPVSIVVPAFNEAVGIERSVRSLAASDYPELEVIVVDDGSADGTADLVEALGLEAVRVLRQANAGKAAALNRGLAAARHDVIVMVDADTLFEPGSLRRLVAPLVDDSVGAVSGNTKVGNRHRLLGRWQHIEYVMGFNLDRRLYDLLRCMPTVPGAIGAFRRDAVRVVGGVSTDTLAEDTDLTIAIGRAGYAVVYAEEARAWTEAPGSLSALWRQRYRWSFGTMQAVWKHRAAIWRHGEGPIGRRGIPYLVLFQILLPALAPLVDLFAIYGIFFLDPVPVVAYWVGFNLVQLALGAYAFKLDGESPRPLWTIPLQQFVYRQLMYIVVLESLISALRGVRLRWQHLERTGDVEMPSVPGPKAPTG